MALNLTNSLQFEINKLSIITKSGEEIDIRNIFEEMNLFDNIFMPYVYGKIAIVDALGLLSKILFDGSEVLKIEIGKTKEDIIFERNFRIFKISDRKLLTQNSEVYVLHFVTDEYILSLQKKINRTYFGTYTNIVASIVKEHLYVNQLTADTTFGNKQVTIPNLSPMDAILWISQRSVDSKKVPNFIFFENRLGFNFINLSTLFALEPIAEFNFTPKNMVDIGEETLGVRNMEVLSQFNFADSIQSGIYAGTFIGFDPITRTNVKKEVSFLDHYGRVQQSNESPNVGVVSNKDRKTNFDMYNSRKTLFTFDTLRGQSNYIKKNYPASISTTDDTFNYTFERRAIFKTFLNTRVRLTVPGNFNVSSGFNVLLNAIDRASKTDDNEDKTLSGKYTIIGTRHIITNQKHETVFDIATNSTKQSSYYKSNIVQTEALNYA
jgi:hypothetical protein